MRAPKLRKSTRKHNRKKVVSRRRNEIIVLRNRKDMAAGRTGRNLNESLLNEALRLRKACYNSNWKVLPKDSRELHRNKFKINKNNPIARMQYKPKHRKDRRDGIIFINEKRCTDCAHSGRNNHMSMNFKRGHKSLQSSSSSSLATDTTVIYTSMSDMDESD